MNDPLFHISSQAGLFSFAAVPDVGLSSGAAGQNTRRVMNNNVGGERGTSRGSTCLMSSPATMMSMSLDAWILGVKRGRDQARERILNRDSSARVN